MDVVSFVKRAADLNLSDTFGMLFLSVICTGMLWGAGSVQLYYYCVNYPSDSRNLKLYVFAIWIIDSVHQALLIWWVYTYFVSHFGNLEYLGVLHGALSWSVLCSGSVCYMVQLFFLQRIYQLSQGKKILTAALAICATTQYAFQLTYFGVTLRYHLFSDLAKTLFLTRAINIVTAVTDTAIAGTLVYLLQKSRTGFSRSESIIDKLIVFVVNTGAATSVSAILVLAMSFAFPEKLVYMFFYFNIARLYVNSLLAMLNYRKVLKTGGSSASKEMSSDNNQAVSLQIMRRNDEARVARLNPEHILTIQVDTHVTRDNKTNSGPGDDDSYTEGALKQLDHE